MKIDPGEQLEEVPEGEAEEELARMRTRHRDDLGTCCCCGKEDATVRNLIMLNQRAPEPGTGWGCVVCHLPPDGAAAIVCDSCVLGTLEIKEVICGRPAEKRRTPIHAIAPDLFEHDMKIHEQEERRIHYSARNNRGYVN